MYLITQPPISMYKIHIFCRWKTKVTQSEGKTQKQNGS